MRVLLGDRGAEGPQQAYGLGSKVWWWVFDREDVLVASYSTQVDPGYPYYEQDEDGAYVKAFIKDVQFTRTTSTPRWGAVTITFNVEPK